MLLFHFPKLLRRHLVSRRKLDNYFFFSCYKEHQPWRKQRVNRPKKAKLDELRGTSYLTSFESIGMEVITSGGASKP